jgi:hypothetical protein
MARTVQEIKQQITTAFLSYPAVRAAYGINSSRQDNEFESLFSKTSIESIFFYVIAFSIHTLERIFDTEKDALIQYVDNLKPHTRQWYVNVLRAFQLGDMIDRETGKYAVIDVAKQIIKYCSMRIKNGELYFLIAADSNGVPEAIVDENKISAIWSYAERVFDAGVHFKIYSADADLYNCKLRIIYDPLILDSEGRRLDGTNDEPVLDAIKGYFKSFPFDSEFSNMAFTDAIQQVEGVRIVQLTESLARPDISGRPYKSIKSTYTANAGYIAFEKEKSEITYMIQEDES